MEIIKEILDYNKNFFLFASKVNKRKSEPKPEERIADRVKLKKGKITEIKNEEKTETTKFLKNTSLIIKAQVTCTKYYARQKVKKKKNEDQVNSIKEVLNRMKEAIKNVSENKKSMITPNQMLSRLPITLAQVKAGNNSEKLRNEIRQLLYSLHRSKKLAKQ